MDDLYSRPDVEYLSRRIRRLTARLSMLERRYSAFAEKLAGAAALAVCLLIYHFAPSWSRWSLWAALAVAVLKHWIQLAGPEPVA